LITLVALVALSVSVVFVGLDASDAYVLLFGFVALVGLVELVALVALFAWVTFFPLVALVGWFS